MDENPYRAPQADLGDRRPWRFVKNYRLSTAQANVVIALVYVAVFGLLAWYIFQPLP